MEKADGTGHRIESATNGPSVTLKSLKLDNLLSNSAARAQPVELGQLNVLIGPNGSGKSNFIEAISLETAPGDLLEPIRLGGGVAEWIWKGERRARDDLLPVIGYPRRPPLADEPSGPPPSPRVRAGRPAAPRRRRAHRGRRPRFAGGARILPVTLPGQAALLGVKDAPHARAPQTRNGRSSAAEHDPDLYPQLNHLAVTYVVPTLPRLASKPHVAAPSPPAGGHAERVPRRGRLEPRPRPQPPPPERPARQAILGGCDIFEARTTSTSASPGRRCGSSCGRATSPRPRPASPDGTMRWLALLAVLLKPGAAPAGMHPRSPISACPRPRGHPRQAPRLGVDGCRSS